MSGLCNSDVAASRQEAKDGPTPPRYSVDARRDSYGLLNWAISEAIAARWSFRAFAAYLLVFGFMPRKWGRSPGSILCRLRHNSESATPLSDVTLRALAMDGSPRTLRSDIHRVRIALRSKGRAPSARRKCAANPLPFFTRLGFTIVHNLPGYRRLDLRRGPQDSREISSTRGETDDIRSGP